jgi:hypothetical protein
MGTDALAPLTLRPESADRPRREVATEPNKSLHDRVIVGSTLLAVTRWGRVPRIGL